MSGMSNSSSVTNCLGLIGVLLLRLDDGVATVALSVVEEFACGDDCFACLCPGNLEGTLAGVVTGLVVPGSVGTGRSLLGLGVPSCVGTGRSLLGLGVPGSLGTGRSLLGLGLRS